MTKELEAKAKDDLAVAHLIDGFIPLFIVPDSWTSEEAINNVRGQGYTTFYVLAMREEVEYSKTTTGTKTSKKHVYPQVFKVTSNLLGSSVTPVDSKGLALAKFESSASFSLPGIPMSLINDIDDFFRLVDDEYGTEAIIMFTYDEAYKDTDNPEDGWGVIVPEQTNTAGSCDYKPESAVDQLPDDPHQVTIMGTAHSHPGMSAYCSHTDKSDQADFDGIHITFGWKPNSLQTEFHIELQTAGRQFTLKEKYAFSGYTDPKTNDKAKEWKKNVKKKGTYSYSGTGTATGFGPTGTGTSRNYNHLPNGLPNPSNHHRIIVDTQLKTAEIKECPVCCTNITSVKTVNYRCRDCHSYIIPDEMDLEQLIAERKKIGAHVAKELDLEDDSQWTTIWLWKEVNVSTGVVDEIVKLRTGKAEKQQKAKDGGTKK